MIELKPFWVSWYGKGTTFQFEYHGPWWIAGETEEIEPRKIFCAAVMAEDANEAWMVIVDGHDREALAEERVEKRFASRRNKNWSPFSDRFPAAEWMKWPYPTENEDEGTGNERST